MNFKIKVFSQNPNHEKEWILGLKKALHHIEGIEIQTSQSDSSIPPLIFVGGEDSYVLSVLDQIDRLRSSVVLIAQDQIQIPSLLKENKVDDVIVYPFRTLDIISKIRNSERVGVFNEMTELSSNFQNSLVQLQRNLELAERLQKSKLPNQFSDIKGFKIVSRYLAGVQSGGDYFDLVEVKGKPSFLIVLAHSSSYSSANIFLNTLSKVLQSNVNQIGEKSGNHQIIKELISEIINSMKLNEKISMLYATLSKEDRVLRFENFGKVSAFYALKDGDFEEVTSLEDPISKSMAEIKFNEFEIELAPMSRLAFVSNGFVELLGGKSAIKSILNKNKNKELQNSLNELVYQVRLTRATPDDLPAMDCTALMIEPQATLLKLPSQ